MQRHRTAHGDSATPPVLLAWSATASVLLAAFCGCNCQGLQHCRDILRGFAALQRQLKKTLGCHGNCSLLNLQYHGISRRGFCNITEGLRSIICIQLKLQEFAIMLPLQWPCSATESATLLYLLQGNCNIVISPEEACITVIMCNGCYNSNSNSDRRRAIIVIVLLLMLIIFVVCWRWLQ